MTLSLLWPLAVLLIGFALVFRHWRISGAPYISAGGGLAVILAAILVWRFTSP
jgi:hypothetical protein